MDAPRHHQHEDDDTAGLAEGQREVAEGAATAAQDRDKQHHHDHGEVLEDEQAEADLPDRRLGLAPVAQELEHDGRRGERHQAARVDADVEIDAEEQEQPGHDRDRDADLQAPAQKNKPLDPRQLLQRKLDPDGEQQQDHANLSGGLDKLFVVDEAERVGADEDARQQKPNDGQQAEPVANVGYNGAGDEQDGDVGEERRRASRRKNGDQCEHKQGVGRVNAAVCRHKAHRVSAVSDVLGATGQGSVSL